MSTKQKPRIKRPAKKAKGKSPGLRVRNQHLERELEELRKENRQLKKSLGALLFKDEPQMMDLTPEAGEFEPSLAELITELERAGKK